jgi:hypothetical protein
MHQHMPAISILLNPYIIQPFHMIYSLATTFSILIMHCRIFEFLYMTQHLIAKPFKVILQIMVDKSSLHKFSKNYLPMYLFQA